ncbi:MAG: hypothetical protein D6675_08430 [Gemmatimonadetes bacterium]|nr:MAG: hypothetical protein D6675_08430 [Gemmatimonadota bacterium]
MQLVYWFYRSLIYLVISVGVVSLTGCTAGMNDRYNIPAYPTAQVETQGLSDLYETLGEFEPVIPDTNAFAFGQWQSLPGTDISKSGLRSGYKFTLQGVNFTEYVANKYASIREHYLKSENAVLLIQRDNYQEYTIVLFYPIISNESIWEIKISKVIFDANEFGSIPTYQDVVRRWVEQGVNGYAGGDIR